MRWELLLQGGSFSAFSLSFSPAELILPLRLRWALCKGEVTQQRGPYSGSRVGLDVLGEVNCNSCIFTSLLPLSGSFAVGVPLCCPPGSLWKQVASTLCCANPRWAAASLLAVLLLCPHWVVALQHSRGCEEPAAASSTGGGAARAGLQYQQI